jgi:hypothetical protein
MSTLAATSDILGYSEISVTIDQSDDTEKMALSLNADDKKWIKEQIKISLDGLELRISARLDALQTSINALQVPTTPRGGKRIAVFLKEWGAMSGAIGAFVALIIFALNSVNTNSEFRGKTNQRLDQIEKDLRELRASSQPHKVIGELAALPTKEFGESLTALNLVTQRPVAEVNPSKTEIATISRKLIATPDEAHDYWPTTFRFISFATTISASGSIPLASSGVTHLRDVHGGPRNPLAVGGSFDNRVLILDGGTFSDFAIKNSRIVFTKESVRLVNMRFINCIFEFPETETPTPYLKDAAREILASDLPSVFITSLG